MLTMASPSHLASTMTMQHSSKDLTPDDVDFDAIMRLMTSRHTVELVDRHVAAVRKVCKMCRQGFLLRHLQPLIELLRLVVQRFSSGQREFAPAICEFTQVASQPLVSCKASDMITYGHHLPTFITTLVGVLGSALPPAEDIGMIDNFEAQAAWEERRMLNERVRIEVAHTLACWSRFGLDENSVELRPNQPLIQAVADVGTPNLRILQQSQAIDELSAAFRVEDSPEAIVIALGAIRDMSLYRPLARQITNCGLISNLIHVIRVNLLGSDVLLVAAEVLWNVLELDWDGAAEALGSSDVIESFRDFMEAALTRGYRFKDKIFRNDMMVLLMYVSKRPENRSLFASTGLMALLLSRAVTEKQRKVLQDTGVLQELMHHTQGGSGFTIPGASSAGSAKDGGSAAEPEVTVALTNSQEDMEFRILLWGTLARCCSSDACADLATRCGFVTSLLSYLDENEVVAEQRQWSQEQRRMMQLEALSALFSLVQYMPSSFIEGRGNSIALRLLQGTPSRDIQRKCLHLLQVAVRTGPEFAQELGAGAVAALIELFKDKDVTMSGRQLCASVLAGLCAGHPGNCREFRKKGGIDAIREEVLYRPDETTENHLFYTLCVIDCVWCAIVGTRKNELRFVDIGGLFALLDVLEVAPLLLKRQIIGCLADLMQNRKAAQLFVQWNSQTTMKGALKILLELWQTEQDNASSTVTSGVIRDIDRPLNPPVHDAAENGAEGQHHDGDSDGSGRDGGGSLNSSRASGRLRHAMAFEGRSKMSITGGVARAGATARSSNAGATNGFPNGAASADKQDARAKIYSILSCVGFDCHDVLNISERQHMELVKLYPDCVQLETWNKVRENLIARGVKPISADLKWIEDSIAERKLQTSWIKSVQQQLADERRSEEQASLHRFYDDIRSRGQFRRTAHKDAGSPTDKGFDDEDRPGGSPRGGGRATANSDEGGFSD